MKRTVSATLSVALILCFGAAQAQKAVVYLKNGEKVEFKSEQLDYIQFEEEKADIIDNILTPEYIPDELFRAYIDNEIAGGSGIFSSAQAAAYDGEINLSLTEYYKCASIKGIEFFKTLTGLNICTTLVPAEDLIPMQSLLRLNCASSKIPVATFNFFEYYPNLEYLSIASNVQENTVDFKIESEKLKIFDCTGCMLNSLDVSGCPELTELIAGGNTYIQSVNFTGCNKLTGLYLQNCYYLMEVDLSSIKANLEELNLSGTYISSIDLSGMEKLREIQIQNNFLSENPNFSLCPNLEFIRCEESQMTEINVQGLTKLQQLHCYNNQISSLDISGLESLWLCNAFQNNLSEISFDNCPSLQTLQIGDNKLKTLDCSGMKNLSLLTAYRNKLESVAVEGCENLGQIDLEDNKIKSINLSDLTNLGTVELQKNELTDIILKNTPSIYMLGLYTNQLSRIDLTGCNKDVLETMVCDDNEPGCEIKVWPDFDIANPPEFWIIGDGKLVYDYSE